jgi:hypothetical protein
MKKCKMLSTHYKCLLLISVIIFFSGQISIAQEANRLLVSPVNKKGTQMNDKVPLKSNEIRKGKIALSQDMLPKIAGAENRKAQIPPSKGDTVSLNLFDDVKYDVTVDSVEHHADGILIVNGKLNDHKLRTVLMTIGSDGYLITVKDMNKFKLYLMNGNSGDGSGSVTEIDMKKVPPVIR